MSEVSILPQGATLGTNLSIEQAVIQPSKTYKIKDGRIQGFIDELEALKQSIELILCIERYEYLIYSWNYGSELKGLITIDKGIAESEFKRRVKEALSQDDRIKNVDNFIFEYEEDSVLAEFTIFSIYGEFPIERRFK
ncbi:DUF2634 domain-containing protein [Clostridium brassicae]|uniref:DUF2634 domain-containing protein n=1 Tax=Clostridium brassicae TaxID=2999072 RepID=A0ABT4D989_9CLOT|nr:DUF2634 domain-containing protein [Clostridium brassicae]MCY6958877.1 DUF2634 domain-containing protein [Clostridium brassicae]